MTTGSTDSDRLGPLALLVGTWRGAGEGIYPTIDTFGYTEEITFVDPQVKPFLAYTQRTRHATQDRPLHAEAGYLRWSAGAPEWVIASPTGVTEVHAGSVSEVDGSCTLHFTSAVVTATPTAKRVSTVERLLHVRGDTLTYELWMGAMGQAHQLHLRADLFRAGT
jgi:hypothetical protein